jgi:hypothetical protein
MPKAEKARSGPITSRELSTAIRHLCWLAAHGPSEHIRTGLLGTITAYYLEEQEREKIPQEPLLHKVFTEARQLPTTVEQIAYFDQLAESETITEGELVFLVHEKTTVGHLMNGILDNHMEKANQEIAKLFRLYSERLGTLYSQDDGKKYHQLCDEGRQRWSAENKQLPAGALLGQIESRGSGWEVPTSGQAESPTG